MNQDTLVKRNSICCNKFVPTRTMLSLFTQAIYANVNNVESESRTVDLLDLDMDIQLYSMMIGPYLNKFVYIEFVYFQA